MPERTRLTILHAFDRLVERVGFSKITVSMLVKEAGVSRATFYRRLKKPYQLTADNMERAAKRLGFSSVDMQRSVMTVCEGVA